MIANSFKSVRKFKWSDLHKKTGTIIVMEPTESDIAEGQFYTLVWFVTADMTMYLLSEIRTVKRKPKGAGKVGTSVCRHSIPTDRYCPDCKGAEK